MAAYPEVEVEIYADDGLVDIVKGGFDAGFRLGESLQADMVAVRVSPPFRFAIAGSPVYFERHGRPRQPRISRQHACIRFRQMTLARHLSLGVRARKPGRSTSPSTVR